MLKPYSADLQRKIGSAHQVLVGRSVHIFIDQLLSLEKSKLAEAIPEMETLVGNQIRVRLCDTDGKNYYISQQTAGAEEEHKDGEPRQAKPISVPITVVFNQHA